MLASLVFQFRAAFGRCGGLRAGTGPPIKHIILISQLNLNLTPSPGTVVGRRLKTRMRRPLPLATAASRSGGVPGPAGPPAASQTATVDARDRGPSQPPPPPFRAEPGPSAGQTRASTSSSRLPPASEPESGTAAAAGGRSRRRAAGACPPVSLRHRRAH